MLAALNTKLLIAILLLVGGISAYLYHQHQQSPAHHKYEPQMNDSARDDQQFRSEYDRARKATASKQWGDAEQAIRNQRMK